MYRKKNKLYRRRFIGLSAMAGAIATTGIGLASCKKDVARIAEDTDYTAIVIGSGFGGAVAALRLGEAGVKTLMLEMGKNFDTTNGQKPFSSQFDPDTRASWLKTGNLEMPINMPFPMKGRKYTGVIDRNKISAQKSMDIFRGTGLGGGSLVYGAMLPRASEQKWDQYFSDITFEEMTSKWYPKVEQMLGVKLVPDDLYHHDFYKYSRIGVNQAMKAGYDHFVIPSGFDFDIMRQEFEGAVDKSVTNGEMMLGVNNGCKKSLDKNYIPSAIGTGNVTVKTQHVVKNVRQLPSEKYQVDVEEIETDGSIVSTKTFTCTHLFMNAGVAGTMDILLRAKHHNELPNLDNSLGTGWGNNGNTMVMRKNIGVNVGIKMSTAPIVAFADKQNPFGYLLAEQAPFPIGVETNNLMYLCLIETPERGYFQYNETLKKVELMWNKSQHDIAINAAKHFINTLNDANGGSVDTFFINSNGYSDNFTYHPLGGAVRNETSDGYGRLKGYKHLYCIDGSQLPGYSAGGNPSLTIAALAERSMAHILSNDF
ncbi:MAG: GMC family oxidoreductase N-terminal domain-containing protein [Chitinophagales bacterium]|nr:GMC family oxidoreductase N-terminal domain-containing protein [Chitinophagales bacterium]